MPGAAVAVVQNNRVILEKGYGVRELGRPETVDANTIFEIGSMTKSFTATAAAILVDEGRLRWNDRVTAHLPQFQFPNPWLTTNVTLEDLAAHRVGLDANLLWAARPWNMDLVIERVRFLTPAGHFGEFFYSNTGMMILGKVVEEASGQTWQSFFEDRLFAPLGMSRSSVERQAYLPRERLAPCWHCPSPDGARMGLSALDAHERNVAAPHGLVVSGEWRADGRRVVEVWPWRDDRAGPAGAVNSTAHDMAQWVMLHLGAGEYEGHRIFSRAQAREMHSVHVTTGERDPEERSAYDRALAEQGYGYGWRVASYRGHRMLWHGGGQVGYSSVMCLFPDRRLGIVVLQNLHFRDTASQRSIALKFADHYLGLSRLDWDSHEGARWMASRRQRELLSPAASAQRMKSHASAFIGHYRNPALGEVAIDWHLGGAALELGPSTADLHFQDRMRAVAVFRGSDRRQISLVLTSDQHGTPTGFVLGEQGELQPLIFKRVSTQ